MTRLPLTPLSLSSDAAEVRFCSLTVVTFWLLLELLLELLLDLLLEDVLAVDADVVDEFDELAVPLVGAKV